MCTEVQLVVFAEWQERAELCILPESINLLWEYHMQTAILLKLSKMYILCSQEGEDNYEYFKKCIIPSKCV